jgi:DNA-binding LacI/PurR family transcriptional regulator
MAVGVLQEAAACGLSVPDDLSVVGFDGIDASAWTTPPLTTIAQPIEELAETAVSALRTLIDEPERELPQFLFRPRLVLRESTAAPVSP